jgi:hypothetical protein
VIRTFLFIVFGELLGVLGEVEADVMETEVNCL